MKQSQHSTSRPTLPPTVWNPLMLHTTKELHGTQDYKCYVSAGEIDFCEEECSFSTCPCDDGVSNMCRALMQEYEMETTANADETEQIYPILRQLFADL